MTSEILPNPVVALEWYSAAALKIMARNRAERGREARSKSDCVELLRAILYEPHSIRRALASLDPIAREALALVKLRGGAISAGALRGQLAVWHPDLAAEALNALPGELVGRALAFWHAPSSRYGSPLVHDLRRPATDNVHSAMLFAPAELLEPVAVPEDLGWRALESLGPAGPSDAELIWQRRLLAFLRAVETRKPKVLQSGQLGVRDREAMSAIVAGYGRAEEGEDQVSGGGSRFQPVAFLRGVLAGAGLLDVSGERVLRTTPEALRFVSLPPVRQAKLLLDSWLESGESELAWLTHLKLDRRASAPTVIPDDERLRRAHRFLLDLIQETVTPGHWYDVADLSNAARWRDVEFLVSWRDPAPYRWSSYYDNGRSSGALYAGISLEDSRGRARSLTLGLDWDLVEGAFIRAVLAGSLQWLGLVETKERPNGVVAFRLTALGAQVLGIEGGAAIAAEPSPSSSTNALIVQPNFEIVVYDPNERLELLFQIDRFAERVSVDRVALFRVTRASFCAGLQLGLRVDDVIELLESVSAAPLPGNVEVSVRDWSRNFESVRWVRNAWLLEGPDAASLDRWLALPALRNALDRRLSPTVALLTGERPPNLPTVLDRLGVETRVIDAAEPLTPSVDVEPNGFARVPAIDSDFFTLAALAEVADRKPDQEGNARFQVTRGSLARARVAGRGALGVLTLFEKVSRRPLPPGFIVRVKGWSGSYRPVALGPVGYLVAPDPECFRELRADPDLAGGFIETTSGSAAIVRLDYLERITDALAERGIEARPYEPPRPRPVVQPAEPPRLAAPPAGEATIRQGVARTREVLDQAIAEHRILVLEYRAPGTTRPDTYLVEPVDVRDRGGTIVLRGFCPTRDAFVDFVLANIVAVRSPPATL